MLYWQLLLLPHESKWHAECSHMYQTSRRRHDSRKAEVGETRMNLFYDVIIIGAGPSGICAANVLGKTGKSVLLLERDPFLGGQLLKQSHMFFGSRQQYAGTRGFEIAEILQKELFAYDHVKVMTDTIASAYYPEEKILLAMQDEKKLHELHFDQLIVATGA